MVYFEPMKNEGEPRGHNFGNARTKYSYEFKENSIRLTKLQIAAFEGMLNENGISRHELRDELGAISAEEGNPKMPPALESLTSNILSGVRTIADRYGYIIKTEKIPDPGGNKRKTQALYSLVPKSETSEAESTSMETKGRRNFPDNLAGRKRRVANGYIVKAPIPKEIPAEKVIDLRLQNALQFDRNTISPILRTSIGNPISQSDWIAQIRQTYPNIRGFHLPSILSNASELGIRIREKEMPDGKKGYYLA